MNASTAQRLREKQEKRRQEEKNLRERAKEKASYVRMFEEQRLAKIEWEKNRVENERIEKIRLEEERAAAELARKTKPYYTVNQYNNKNRVEGAPTYIGDFVGPANGSSWLPHGEGEFLYEGSTYYEGRFKHGFLHGNATYNYHKDDTKYVGRFSKGNMHGIAKMIQQDSGIADVLMRNNIVICNHDELIVGKQVDLFDPSVKIFSKDNPSNPARVTILHHMPSRGYTDGPTDCLAKPSLPPTKNSWRYKVRFHEEVRPRERENYTNLPFTDTPTQYNYINDTYRTRGKLEAESILNGREGSSKVGGSSGPCGTAYSPSLGFAGSSKDGNMRPREIKYIKGPGERDVSLRDENLFETSAIGVGAAEDEEKEAERQMLKKLQWTRLIDQRKKEQEEQRQKEVVEAQKKMLEDALAANKKATEERNQKEAEAQAQALKEEEERFAKQYG